MTRGQLRAHQEQERLGRTLATMGRKQITQAELAEKKRHDYYGMVDGVPCILTMDPETGATVLQAVEIVP